MLVMRAGIHKMLVRIANRETLIRLLLQRQFDLGLHCLPMPFWQATSALTFKPFTIHLKIEYSSIIKALNGSIKPIFFFSFALYFLSNLSKHNKITSHNLGRTTTIVMIYVFILKTLEITP